jgi:PEP-CTERM motif
VKETIMLQASKWTAVVLVLVAGTAQASQIGPIGTYYLTDYINLTTFQSSLDAIQGNNYVQNPSIYQYQEGPIAVFAGSGVLRTTGYQTGAGGGEYAPVPSLTVSPTGPTYTNNWQNDLYYDSTTNGSSNFLVGLSLGNVIETSTTFGGGTVLFNTGQVDSMGITYDRTNNSLWIQNSETGVITDYTLTGGVITSFATNAGSNTNYSATALALDVDHTLWFDDYGAGTIEHYTTTGTYLGSASYAGLGYVFGGEIGLPTAVPEPASLTLFGLGAVGIAVGAFHQRRRQKNTG